LLTSLGWANRLTLARGWLIAMCAGLLFQPAATAGTAWLPAIGYSLAAIADRFDGYVARRTRNTTVLGSELDMSFDAIGLVIAPLLAVSYGKLHPLYLLVSVAYYFFVAGIYWRRRHGKPVLPLRKSELRRTLAGMQMGFVAFVLWPPLQPTLTIVAGIAFMLPLLAGFWIDWLVVSARLPAHTKEAEQQFQQRKEFSHQWLQPALRVVLLASLALAEWQQRGNVPLTLLLIAVCLLILLGIAGRTLAVLLLLLLNWTPGVDFTSTIGVLIVFSAVWILVLGTGRFTLWQRDADWITQQGGA
jgi:CDP-diacylglycerol--glycerol-3-phosphate 3-phosphatidyltransferase